MDRCTWCVTAGKLVDEDYIAGHNTRRLCRNCGKRWCTQHPIESYETVESFCSPACRAAWPRRRRCEVCDDVLPILTRIDRLTCSVRCRVALHRQRKRDLSIPT